MANEWNKEDAKYEASQEEIILMTRILDKLDRNEDNKKEYYQQNNQKQVYTIDLVELFYYLLSKWYLIVLGLMIGGFIMCYRAYVKVPIYKSTSKLYILGDNNKNNGEGTKMTDLQVGSALTGDYQEIFKAWEVNHMVNELMGTDYDYEDLQEMLTVTNPEDTHMLYITIQNPDAKLAADLANAYAVSAQQFISEAFDMEKPIKFSSAIPSEVPINSSFLKSLLIGLLAGAVLVTGVLCVIFIFDNRPKSEDDIVNYGGIPMLAMIPKDPTMSNTKNNKSRKTK